MGQQMNSEELVGVLRDTIVALVRREGVDLSARQLGVFLTCYLNDDAHTVRGLASELNVSKPAITRALDRLSDLDLARRKVDPSDRRIFPGRCTMAVPVRTEPSGPTCMKRAVTVFRLFR